MGRFIFLQEEAVSKIRKIVKCPQQWSTLRILLNLKIV